MAVDMNWVFLRRALKYRQYILPIHQNANRMKKVPGRACPKKLPILKCYWWRIASFNLEKRRSAKSQLYTLNRFYFSHLMRLRHFSSNAYAQSSSGARCLIFVGSFVYFHTLCVRTAKALTRLRGCAGSSEHSLVAYVISIIISWAGSFIHPQLMHELKPLVAEAKLASIPALSSSCRDEIRL